jgi:S-adenosylmethionine:tRNA ribosyltransferase-isomerase
MRLSDFDYTLPRELIAQEPLPEREKSRLLVVNRTTQAIEHRQFEDILDYLADDDLIVMNDTRVTAKRLYGRKSTGGAVEALLMKRMAPGLWRAMVKPGRRVQIGAILEFEAGLEHPELVERRRGGLTAEVVERTEEGGRILRFSAQTDPDDLIEAMGEVPLPPYIHKRLSDPDRYQTVYAAADGSAAAPTAGLHFSEGLLAKIAQRGIRIVYVTLDVGVATFRPVRVEDIDLHDMHSERFEIGPECAEEINSAKGRVVCVGTTTARALESAAVGRGRVAPAVRDTRLFIRPPYDFAIVGAMVTNFHIPKSTLLMLVSAFAGTELIRRAYAEAVRERYRFLSFGDAMLLY